jgi:uncharacterized protein (DUF1501 family)
MSRYQLSPLARFHCPLSSRARRFTPTRLPDDLPVLRLPPFCESVESDVTTFTESDFSRTFQPNANCGTDHAWGSHHMGSAVDGATLASWFGVPAGQLSAVFPSVANFKTAYLGFMS